MSVYFTRPAYLAGLLLPLLVLLASLARKRSVRVIEFPPAKLLAALAGTGREATRRRSVLLALLRILLLSTIPLLAAGMHLRSPLFPPHAREPVHAVILLDDSPHMLGIGQGDSQSLFANAKATAAWALSRVAPGYKAAILTTSGVQIGPSTDVNELQQRLNGLEPSSVSGSLESTFVSADRAAAACAHSRHGAGGRGDFARIYVLTGSAPGLASDPLRNNPQSAIRNLQSAIRNRRSALPIHLFDAGQVGDDLAVTSVKVEQRFVFAGATARIVAWVRSFQTRKTKRVVNLILDGKTVDSRPVEVEGWGKAKVVFEAAFNTPGAVFGRVELSRSDEDALRADDSRYFTVNVLAPPTVACVAQGEAAEALAHAFSPAPGRATCCRPVVIPPSELVASEDGTRGVFRLDEADAAVVVNDGLGAGEWKSLERFASRGGSLLVFGPPGPSHSERPVAAENSFRISDTVFDHPLFREFGPLGAAEGFLERVRFTQVYSLDPHGPRGPWRILARFQPGGKPAVIERSDGRMIAVGSGFLPPFSELAEEAAFVVLLHEAVRHLAALPEASIEFESGTTVRLTLPARVRDGRYRLARLPAGGDSSPCHAETRLAGGTAELGEIRNPGCYRLIAEGERFSSEVAFSVNAAVRFGRPSEDAGVPTADEQSADAIEVAANMDELREMVRRSGAGVSLSHLLGALALLLFAAEAILAQRG